MSRHTLTGVKKLSKLAATCLITSWGVLGGARVDAPAEGVSHMPMMASGRWMSEKSVQGNRPGILSLKGIEAAARR